MAKWTKIIVSPEGLNPGKLYFIARQAGREPFTQWFYLSQPLRGPKQWSTKPGIACKYTGGPDLEALLRKHSTEPEHMRLQAVEVPTDADTRWRARKPVARTYNRRPA